MKALVAWSPEPKKSRIFSIFTSEGRGLDLPQYLHCLNDRLQAMIDKSPDPQVLVSRMNQLLEEGGLMAGPLSSDPEDAANTLITSNPNVRRRLQELGLPIPTELQQLKPIETLAARQELEADRADPESRFESWISAISFARGD